MKFDELIHLANLILVVLGPKLLLPQLKEVKYG